jgi:hypothetical protein
MRVCSYLYLNHELISYKDTKAKCRHKKWPVKGLYGRCLSEIIDWRCWYVGIFDQALWTVAPLPFSLVQLSPSSLSFVNKYCILYAHILCVRGGVWGSGPQTEKQPPQSPLADQFFRRRHFAMFPISLIFLRSECWLASCLSSVRMRRIWRGWRWSRLALYVIWRESYDLNKINK